MGERLAVAQEVVGSTPTVRPFARVAQRESAYAICALCLPGSFSRPGRCGMVIAWGVGSRWFESNPWRQGI